MDQVDAVSPAGARRSSRAVVTRRRHLGRRSAQALAAVLIAATGVGASVGSAVASASPSRATKRPAHLSVNPSLRKLLPPAIRKAGVVHVASDMPFPPYEYTVNGHLTGFEYDLAQDMGKLLGVRFTFMQQPLAGVVPGMTAGKYDIGMSDMADTPSREKTVDMVDEYLAVQGWLVQKGNPEHLKTATDLCGKTIAVSQGGFSQILVSDFLNGLCKKDHKPPAKPLTYSTQASTFLAVKSGKAVTTVNDGGAMGYLARTVGGGKVYSVVILKTSLGGVIDGAIAVSRTQRDKGLSRAIQATLQKLMDDGAYGGLIKKYHIEFSTLKVATINYKR